MPFDSPSTIDPVLDVLVTAKDRVQRGWLQSSFKHDGRFCPWGAVTEGNEVEDDFELPMNPTVRAAVEALHRAVPVRYRFLAYVVSPRNFYAWRAVAVFNDAPWRRKARVLRLFDRAIRRRSRQ